jgi:hypothetical protein
MPLSHLSNQIPKKFAIFLRFDLARSQFELRLLIFPLFVEDVLNFNIISGSVESVRKISHGGVCEKFIIFLVVVPVGLGFEEKRLCAHSGSGF